MVLAENTDRLRVCCAVFMLELGLKTVKFPYKRGYSSPVHSGSPETLLSKLQVITLKEVN